MKIFRNNFIQIKIISMNLKKNMKINKIILIICNKIQKKMAKIYKIQIKNLINNKKY